MQKDRLNDWLFRYRYIYRSRLSDRSKKRFLNALVTDISQIRKDIRVIEYDLKHKAASRNVYIGDIAQADRIICTYYDTPPQHFGVYHFFDRKAQGRQTMNFILVSSFITIGIGAVATWFYSQFAADGFVLFSWQTFFLVLAFGSYFLLLGKVVKGAVFQKNLTRNTSSVLALLALISENERQNTAFAFLDEGSYGERGLEVLRDSAKRKATIYYLDSVGAKAPLHVVGTEFDRKQLARLGILQEEGIHATINYVISGNKESTEGYYLPKQLLKQKDINMENVNKTIALLQ